MSIHLPHLRGVTLLPMAALLGILAGGTFVGASSTPAAMTFTVVAQDSEANVSPPDFFAAPAAARTGIEDAPVYRDGTKVGTAQTVTTITRAASDDVIGILTCSVELPEGTILFEGSFHPSDFAAGLAMPVVGGTGDYAGSVGIVTLTTSADQSSTALAFDIHKP